MDWHPYKRYLPLIACLACLALGLALVVPIIRPYVKNRFLASPLGEYQCVVFDPTGKKVAEGEIIITVYAYQALKGRWRLRYLENNQPRFELFSGEEVESEFAGTLVKQDFRLNLNPAAFDGNDYLIGKLANNTVQGEFQTYGYANVTTVGTFKAVRK